MNMTSAETDKPLSKEGTSSVCTVSINVLEGTLYDFQKSLFAQKNLQQDFSDRWTLAERYSVRKSSSNGRTNFAVATVYPEPASPNMRVIRWFSFGSDKKLELFSAQARDPENDIIHTLRIEVDRQSPYGDIAIKRILQMRSGLLTIPSTTESWLHQTGGRGWSKDGWLLHLGSGVMPEDFKMNINGQMPPDFRCQEIPPYQVLFAQQFRTPVPVGGLERH